MTHHIYSDILFSTQFLIHENGMVTIDLNFDLW